MTTNNSSTPTLIQNSTRERSRQCWQEQLDVVEKLREEVEQNGETFDSELEWNLREADGELEWKWNSFKEWSFLNDPTQFIQNVGNVEVWQTVTAIERGWEYVGTIDIPLNAHHMLEGIEVVEVWRTPYKEYVGIYSDNEDKVRWFVMSQEQLALLDYITDDFKTLLAQEAEYAKTRRR
jgi:hypothetical protein